MKRMTANIREFNTRAKQKCKTAVKMYARQYIETAKEFCPKRTGRLRNSIGNPNKEGIYKMSPNGLSVTIGTKVPYCTIVENGIRFPYPITPKNKKWLKFKYKGKTIYAKKVTHPSMEGKWFMLRGHIAAQCLMDLLMKKKISY